MIVPVVVYAVSARSPKVYEASVLMEVEPTSIDTASDTSGGPNAQFIAIAARLIATTGVAQRAADFVPGARNEASQLLASIKIDIDPATGFITITASAGSPNRAAQTANAFAQAVNSARAHQAIIQLNQSLSNLQGQLDALPAHASLARNQLARQITRLRAQRAAQGTNTQVIEPATPPSSPVSPRPLRNTALAIVVAVLLGLALVAVVEALDRKLRSSDDVEAFGGAPVLTTLPRSAFDGNLNAPLVIERLRGLRASLSFFNVDRNIQSIVVVSGRQGEGKSLVSLGLARAYEAAGSSVILVDADLRRPTLASRLGIPAGTGLAGVLVGRTSVSEALMAQMRGENPTGLRVLPSGDLPPNPSELLGSERMKQVLNELTSMCDVVIVDTSPLLAVSDAMPLMDDVSGTLVVSRLGVTARDDLRQVRRLVTAASSAALGFVVTGGHTAPRPPRSTRHTFSLHLRMARRTVLRPRRPAGLRCWGAAAKNDECLDERSEVSMPGEQW